MPGSERERPLLIGLTGPIGCGKSAVASMLAEVGGTVIDADQLAREVTGPGAPVLAGIRRRFGDGVFAADGALDRPALAELVFNDARALADLEALTHPLVRQLVEERLAAASREHVPFVVIEAIKLVEGGLAARCDEAWLVDCTPVNQRARLVSRGSGEADAERRMAAQGPGLADRLAAQLAALAHGPRVRRLATDGSLDETRTAAEDALADALQPFLD